MQLVITEFNVSDETFRTISVPTGHCHNISQPWIHLEEYEGRSCFVDLMPYIYFGVYVMLEDHQRECRVISEDLPYYAIQPSLYLTCLSKGKLILWLEGKLAFYDIKSGGVDACEVGAHDPCTHGVHLMFISFEESLNLIYVEANQQ